MSNIREDDPLAMNRCGKDITPMKKGGTHEENKDRALVVTLIRRSPGRIPGGADHFGCR